MAIDMFLKIDGIKGESVADGYVDQIDLIAFGLGMANTIDLSSGGGGGAGAASVQDISITKYLDKSTPAMMKKLMKGEHLGNAKLVLRKPGGDYLEYFVIQLEGCMLGHYRTMPETKNDRVVENWSLGFTYMNVVYTPQGMLGTGSGTVEFAWDVTKRIEGQK